MGEHVERMRSHGKELYKQYAPFRVKVKEGVSGLWAVQKFNTEINLMYARNAVDDRDPGLGKFTRLVFAGATTVMSDTAAEVRDLLPYLHRLQGDVLITGLGLGMTIHALTTIEKYSKHVKSILVVEKSADVIKLSAKYYRDPRVKIVNEDAYSYTPNRSVYKFDAAWHDVWNDLSSSNEFRQMRRHWQTYMKAPDCQYCWGEVEAKAQDKRYGYA